MRKHHRTSLRVADLTDLRGRLRPGFLLSFSIAGLLAVGLLAFAVSRIMGGDIRTEQLTSATRSAELLTASSFESRLASRGQLDVTRLAALDQAALAARRTAGLEGVAIWDRRSRVVYSTDHKLIGATMLPSGDVRAAFAGQTVTTVRDGAQSPIGHFGRQIDVSVPIYSRGRRKPIAVAEVMLPYAPVAREISNRTQRIDFILIGAALLFYAALWRSAGWAASTGPADIEAGTPLPVSRMALADGIRVTTRPMAGVGR
jgi:hypothetical protein